MSKKESELMSKNAYAKYLGVSEKAVRNAVTDGKIKKGWDAVRGKIIKHLADKEYGFLHQNPKAGPGVGKAKLIEKLTSEKNTAKLSKSRTKDGESSDASPKGEKSEVTSDISGADDLSKLDAAELLLRLPITADMGYNQAVRVNEIIDAALKKKKLEEMEDILVRRVNVESALFAFGSQLRKALMAIPARVTDEMMNAANKIEAINILTEEIVSTLDQYSNIETIKLTNKN